MPNYTQTYWSSKGTYQKLLDELNKLVPTSGEVENAVDNPALEKFRQASNCYYDLYNNGLCNRGEEFKTVFGFAAHTEEPDNDGDLFDRGLSDNEFNQELVDRVETLMDSMILTSAIEQGLISTGIHKNYDKLTDRQREALDIAIREALHTLKGFGVRFNGSDPIERAVDALAAAILDANEIKADDRIGAAQ